MLDIHALPNDVEGLRRLVIERESAFLTQLREKQQQIEHLKFQLSQLRRARFGRSSEQLAGAGQLPLTLQELQAAIVAERQIQALPERKEIKGKPVRRQRLPEHFERLTEVIEPRECRCAECGAELKPLGRADEAEVLEVKTVTFTVRRQIRPKRRCGKCSSIFQAPAPTRPIPKSFAGASLLALILSWKYGFHLPAVSAMPDLCAGGTEDQPHEPHAVGSRLQ